LIILLNHGNSNIVQVGKMNDIELLENQIKLLKEEIKNNSHYPASVVNSILDDIDYYQNHLNELKDQ
jgi:hypothetical protein